MSAVKIPTSVLNEIESRIHSLDWPQIEASLHSSGWAKIGPVLTAEECAALRELYGNDQLFRSRIIMERYRFGL
ncbi:MAG TPA: proline hydroxylase, partial [Candidatus Angelobacter sp.]|nr:proline hydroxylase [Candidatus Angelobacter sp.]